MLKKALNQAMPTGIDSLYDKFCKALKKELIKEDYQASAGTKGITLGDYHLVIDWRILQGKCEYSCPLLYYKGKEVRITWTGTMFDYDANLNWYDYADNNGRY